MIEKDMRFFFIAIQPKNFKVFQKLALTDVAIPLQLIITHVKLLNTVEKIRIE